MALTSLLNDKYLFFIVQVIYLLLFLIALSRDILERWQKKHKTRGSSASVIRGEKSMSKLHSVYVAMTFLIVLVILNVQIIENHRVIFIVIDVGVLAYLCFFNAWFRNKLIGWIFKSASIEE